MDTHDPARHDFRNRIVVDPKMLIGKPVIEGTRIPVSLILNLVGHRSSFAEIVEDYPVLTLDDIHAAILYAGARLEREEVYSLTTKR